MLLTSPPGSLRGARRPRVEVHPPHVDTFGVEAGELIAQAGQRLDPWQQDAVDIMLGIRADGQWSCPEYAEIVSRQNGKGGILEARVLAGFFLLGEQLILWSAHEYKTAMEAFRRVRGLVRALGKPINETTVAFDGFVVKMSNTNGEEGFERSDTGQRIKFIARSKSSGRGFSGDLNIIDEAFAYTIDQQDALMPTLSARPNPQIVYTSSPPLDGKSGVPLFALKARAEAGGDDSLGYRDWGAAGDLEHVDKIDLGDRALWAATNPAFGIRISEETVGRELRSMGAAGFARERLGVWPKPLVQGGGEIDPAVWAALLDPDSTRDKAHGLALGVDIAPRRDYAAINVYGLRPDGLGHLQVVDYRPGTDWIVGRLVQLRDALDPAAIGMGRGTYASLEPELTKAGIVIPEDPDRPQRGDLAVTNAVDMAAACGQVVDAVRQATLRHVGDQPLDMAVAGAKVRVTGDAIAWSRKDADADIGPLVAGTVARWAYETRAHLVVDDYDPLANIW